MFFVVVVVVVFQDQSSEAVGMEKEQRNLETGCDQLVVNTTALGSARNKFFEIRQRINIVSGPNVWKMYYPSPVSCSLEVCYWLLKDFTKIYFEENANFLDYYLQGT